MLNAVDEILATIRRVHAGETLWLTKQCPRCRQLYTREVEPEWAGVVARGGICDGCYLAQEEAR